MKTNTPIYVPYGIMRRLQDDGFGTQPTIRKALRGTYNPNNLAERTRALAIRMRALKLGGIMAATQQEGGRQ